MAPEHSPLYKSIAEQLSAYIDKAVTEPMEHWRPPWTGRHHELPMEVLYDYDMLFPLPTGLEDIIGVAEASEEQKSTLQGVLCDMLAAAGSSETLPISFKSFVLPTVRMHIIHLGPGILGTQLHLSPIMLFSPARKEFSSPTDRILALQSTGNLTSAVPSVICQVVILRELFLKKRLPDYIGSKVHARLVDVKSRLDAVGLGHLLGLVQPS
ncbi:hypothetical protein BDP27DRAFT_215766 [Rhodocollybia butyracea]|uniref:Uncharacterized protein n=1 Tax=Rhodocollybia butyracea TaxID=206335 RepID=A0A9P5P2I2_9AGAR|nr:hypothetical protein BDP27DRAFT_215766 [Rhodocollybia butyracea]